MTLKNLHNSTGDLNYPKVLPTLDLNFANSKSLDSRITFTRSSGGSYIGPDGLIKYTGVNQPRFDHDPVTGESLGLMVESSRTNLLIYSEQIDNVIWTKTGITSIQTNKISSPEGTITADTFVETTGVSELHGISQTFSTSSGTIYTASAYLKANQRHYANLSFSPNATWNGTGANAYFDLQNGIVFSTTNCAAIIQESPNGWFRCIIIATATGTNTTANISINSSINGSSVTYAGNGSSPFYIWGTQVEVGAFQTSYIPTVASQRTRAADDVSITGVKFSSWYNQNEGVMYSNVSVNRRFPSTSVEAPGVWTLDNGGFGRGYGLITQGSFTNYTLRIFQQGISFSNIVANLMDTKKLKNCSIISPSVGNEILSCSNSNFSTRLTSFSSNLIMTRLIIGNNNIGGAVAYLNGNIKRLTYYPRKLSISQLQTLTK